jgi:hypothetical protein
MGGTLNSESTAGSGASTGTGTPKPSADGTAKASRNKMTGHEPNFFVKETFDDTTKIEEVQVFSGFLGRAPGYDGQRYRLFTTLELKAFVEFDAADVLAIQDPERRVLGTDGKLIYKITDPFGMHIVSLKRRALVRFEPPELQQQASFVSGGIADGYLPQMGGYGFPNRFVGRRRPGFGPDSDLGCSTLPICQS